MTALKWILRHWYIWATLPGALWVTITRDHSHPLIWAWASVGWTISLAFAEARARTLEDVAGRWRKNAEDWKRIAKGWEQIAEEQER